MRVGGDFSAVIGRRFRQSVADKQVAPEYEHEFVAWLISREPSEAGRMKAAYAKLCLLACQNKMLFEQATPEEIEWRIRRSGGRLHRLILGFSRNYKTGNQGQSCLEAPVPCVDVVKRLRNDVDRGVVPTRREEPRPQTQFFPEDRELVRLARLFVRSGICKDDEHHCKIRGLWYLRDCLQRLGESAVQRGLLNESTAVYDLSADAVCRLADGKRPEHTTSRPALSKPNEGLSRFPWSLEPVSGE